MLFEWQLFNNFILRDIRKNLIRTGLTLAGITLGVSVMLSIILANSTALSKFKETVNLVSGKANIEIRSNSAAGLDENLIADLRGLWHAGVKFTPLIQSTVVYNDKDYELIQLIGIDMLGDQDFKTFESDKSESSSSSSSSSDGDLLRPQTVLVGARLAHDHRLKVGDHFSLLINRKPESFTVSGIMSEKGLGGVFSGNLVVTDISFAQNALASPGKITAVQILAPPEMVTPLIDDLKEKVAADVIVMRPSQKGEQVEKMTRSFEYNLIALTFIAMMVGMFLIYNTITISVIRRRTQIGTLRALGVSRLQIASVFCFEALWFGIIGSFLGVAAGLFMANGALRAIASTFQHFYFQDPIESVKYDPSVLFLVFGIGVSLTFVAALPPVFEAATVAPAEATRRASYEAKISRLSGKFALLSILLLVAAAVSGVQPPVDNFPIFGYLAALLSILGFASAIPLILNAILPAVSKLFAAMNQPEAQIAARSLQGTLARTSVASASLMIGIAMMISLAIMIGSFRRTVLMWVDQTLHADLWLQSMARAEGSSEARYPESLVAKIKKVEGIDAVDGFVEMPFTYKGEPTRIGAGDFDVIAKHGHLVFTRGESSRSICADMGAHTAIISETFAIRKHVEKGETIEIATPSGPYTVKVMGIYYDYASDLGYIIISRNIFKDLFHDNSLSNAAIYLKPGYEPFETRKRLLAALKDDGMFYVRTTGELRKEAIKIFDRTFAITYALHTIAIGVSILAVMNALFALTLESKREFGILRYIGASRAALRKIVLTEAGLLGIFGNSLGVALGVVLSILLIFVINKQSFGWTVQLAVPTLFIVQSSLLTIGTAVLSGILPAVMAARVLAPAVVRDE